MSGILDSKSRVMDTILTEEGRSQLAFGGIDVSYITFTDGAAFYAQDVVSGSQDATKRIYFEACSLPQDQITLKANLLGHVDQFANMSGIRLKDGKSIVSNLTSSHESTTTQYGDQFSVTVEKILSSSLQNFNNLYTIGTQDSVFDTDGFAVGPSYAEFVVRDGYPVDYQRYNVNIDNIESIFQDPRFSNVTNFKFLPPINKIDDKSVDKKNSTSLKGKTLGTYRPFGSETVAKPIHLESDLQSANFQSVQFSFDPTSKKNRMMCQFFESTNDTLTKMDIVNFGKYSGRQYFLVGKVVQDNKGTDTFLHTFTMIFGA